MGEGGECGGGGRGRGGRALGRIDVGVCYVFRLRLGTDIFIFYLHSSFRGIIYDTTSVLGADTGCAFWFIIYVARGVADLVYILNEDTQPVIRAIGVSHTELAKMSFDQIFDRTEAGMYFNFFIISYVIIKRIYNETCRQSTYRV